MVGGAAALMEEVAATKISGEEDRYSHTDLWDFQANFDGSQKIFELFRPLLAKDDKAFVEKVERQLRHGRHDPRRVQDADDGFESYDKLTDADREALPARSTRWPRISPSSAASSASAEPGRRGRAPAMRARPLSRQLGRAARWPPTRHGNREGFAMDYVRFGTTGLKVSRLCLGCMTYGDPGWREWVLDEDAAGPFIREAWEAGINFFDTADMYSPRRAARRCSAAR